MFDNTTRLIKKSLEDAKRIARFGNIVAQLVYIAYLVYAVATKAGFFYLNIALLCLTIIYFVVQLVLDGRPQTERKIKRRVKSAFKLTRRLIQIAIVGSSLLGLYIDKVSIVTLPVLFSVVSAGTLVINLVLDLFIYMMSLYFESFEKAFNQDREEFLETRLGKVVNFGIKKVAGKKKDEDSPRPKSKELTTNKK